MFSWTFTRPLGKEKSMKTFEKCSNESLSKITGGKGIDWGKAAAAGVGCGLITWWTGGGAVMGGLGCLVKQAVSDAVAG